MLWDVLLFLWNKVKVAVQGDDIQSPTFTYCIEKIDNFEKVSIRNTAANSDSSGSLLTYALQLITRAWCPYTNVRLSVAQLCAADGASRFGQLWAVTFLQWLWCLHELCEVASVCSLANLDCMVAAEMTYTLAALLERAAETRHQSPS